MSRTYFTLIAAHRNSCRQGWLSVVCSCWELEKKSFMVQTFNKAYLTAPASLIWKTWCLAGTPKFPFCTCMTCNLRLHTSPMVYMQITFCLDDVIMKFRVYWWIMSTGHKGTQMGARSFVLVFLFLFVRGRSWVCCLLFTSAVVNLFLPHSESHSSRWVSFSELQKVPCRSVFLLLVDARTPLRCAPFSLGSGISSAAQLPGVVECVPSWTVVCAATARTRNHAHAHASPSSSHRTGGAATGCSCTGSGPCLFQLTTPSGRATSNS